MKLNKILDAVGVFDKRLQDKLKRLKVIKDTPSEVILGVSCTQTDLKRFFKRYKTEEAVQGILNIQPDKTIFRLEIDYDVDSTYRSRNLNKIYRHH